MFSTQGVTAPTGTTVNINFSRLATYYAYLLVYVDWNDNGTYELTEQAGSTLTLPAGTGGGTYSFTIPLTGIVTNSNIHMRVFLGEPPSSGGAITTINPPCSAKWGQANDYYLKATCSNPSLAVTPPTPVICGIGSVNLTASGAGSTPTYTWSPASSLSATTGATVTSSPGSTITYTVTGYGPGVCLATTAVTVTVNPGITPVISTSGSTSFCRGGSVVLSETSGIGVSYQWYNGASAIAGATNSTYTASPTATTSYSVLVTSASGCTGTAAVTVTVLATPTAVITPAGATTVCSPNTVLLNATTGAGYTYRWFNTAGVITGSTSISYTASTTSNYKVEITATTGCKDTSASVAVVVNPAPTAVITASGALTFCSYDSVVLTATTSAGYSYQWMDGTTVLAGATNTTYTARTPGTHNYRLKVTNSFGCSDTTASGAFVVVVNVAPVSAITASGPLSFCTGSNVTLSTLAAGGNTYQWYFGASAATATPISGATASAYTAAVTGYYYVKVTTPAGCTTNSMASAVLVTVVDIPAIMYGSSLSFCWGGSVNLYLTISSSASGITYQWKHNSINITGATSTTYNAMASGYYTCFINIGGGCVGTTAAVYVNVFPLVNPPINYIGGYLRTLSSYASFQWYKGSAIIPGATTYMLHPTDTGDYAVIVTDTNGCHSVANTYPLHKLTLGVAQANAVDAPTIYPNPATDKVFIKADVLVHAVVSGIDGRTLLEGYSVSEMDIASLAPGLYMIALFDENGQRLLVEKLVKK